MSNTDSRFNRMAAAYEALTADDHDITKRQHPGTFCDCGEYIADGRICECMRERARQVCPVCTERVPECRCVECHGCGDKVPAEDAIESTAEWQCGVHVPIKLCGGCS